MQFMFTVSRGREEEMNKLMIVSNLDVEGN
jgi:hypothetical protein